MSVPTLLNCAAFQTSHPLQMFFGESQVLEFFPSIADRSLNPSFLTSHGLWHVLDVEHETRMQRQTTHMPNLTCRGYVLTSHSHWNSSPPVGLRVEGETAKLGVLNRLNYGSWT